MRRLAALLLILPAPLLAQQQDAFQRLDANPSFRQAAEKTFLQYEASLSTHCDHILPDWNAARQTVYVPLRTGTDGKSAGVWSLMVPGTACAEPRRFRAVVAIRQGSMGFSRQLPGTSNASAVLERDARPVIALTLGSHNRSLNATPDFDVLDTELIGPNPPGPHQSWKEIWLIRAGGTEMRVPIEFVPDPNGGGTSFHVSAREIVDIPPGK